jgi:hemin uptake protein HemP
MIDVKGAKDVTWRSEGAFTQILATFFQPGESSEIRALSENSTAMVQHRGWGKPLRRSRHAKVRRAFDRRRPPGNQRWQIMPVAWMPPTVCHRFSLPWQLFKELHSETVSARVCKEPVDKQTGQAMNEKKGLPPTEDGNHQMRDRTDGMARVARVSSAQLLDASGRLIIEHNGQEYVLRITRSGKLILTK